MSGKYQLGQSKRLIDLNGETAYFSIDFRVTSNPPGKVFHAVVVNQQVMDSDESLNFREVQGTISGNVKNDTSGFQNYFLALKSDEPIEVDVQITKTELPTPSPSAPAPAAQPAVQPNPYHPVHHPVPHKTKKSSGFPWKWVLIAVILIGGGILLYLMYNKKGPFAESSSVAEAVGDVLLPPLGSSATPTVVASVAAPTTPAVSSRRRRLLGRLHKIAS